jgi:hypothetical protein
MTSNPVIELLFDVLLQILITRSVFYGHRRLDMGKPRHSIFFGAIYGGFVLAAYQIPTHLNQIFPGLFSMLLVFLLSSGFVVACLFMGYFLDRFLLRFRWFD